jgi:hypothetical protein
MRTYINPSRRVIHPIHSLRMLNYPSLRVNELLEMGFEVDLPYKKSESPSNWVNSQEVRVEKG